MGSRTPKGRSNKVFHDAMDDGLGGFLCHGFENKRTGCCCENLLNISCVLFERCCVEWASVGSEWHDCLCGFHSDDINTGQKSDVPRFMICSTSWSLGGAGG